MLLQENEITDIRKKIYFEDGYFIIKQFLSKERVKDIQNFWCDKGIEYEFNDFIKNRKLTIDSPKYMYNKPTKNDFAYCTQIWNTPLDERLHEEVFIAQIIRNQIEGKPFYYGLHESTKKALQYRVCRTVSNLTAVNMHADFFEEYRPDPTGDHTFDPSRIQIHIMLSDYGKDYTGGGFKLWNEKKDSYKIIGKDIKISSGDLLLWRYSLPHEVSEIISIDENIGFMRIICPLFDIKSENI